MLSFMLPGDDKGFTLNGVSQPQQTQPNGGTGFSVTNGHVTGKTEVTAPDLPSHGSPNNNSHPATPLLASVTSALDNMTSAAPLSRDLNILTSHDLSLGCYSGTSSLLEDSYSDDTTNESTLLIRAEDRSDEHTQEVEIMTPSTENTRSSPCGDERPLLSSQHSTITTVPGKTGKLKRVSFGSSKGSMVETVVYDYEPAQPLREEDSESPDPHAHAHAHPRPAGTRHTFVTSTPLSAAAARSEPSAAERAAARVRVTYFESKKPLLVPAVDGAEAALEEEDHHQEVAAPPAALPAHTQVTTEYGEMPTTYIVQTMDAGWENPFRPGGELSKEADQIVRAIQSGRPLDSSLDEPDSPAQANGAVRTESGGGVAAQNGVQEPLLQPVTQISVTASAPGAKQQDGTVRNGSGAPETTANSSSSNAASSAAPQTVMVASIPGTVEVQHSLVKPEDASQVEQVTLKKKPRGKCCVLQ